jgi:crotonobetainyl-CoA:carnitine CoA-transferase CaiB-like acyl-CoA transferase
MLLADMGAHVIKVEPLGGDPFRAYRSPSINPHAVHEFLGINRNKRSIALDDRAREGVEIFQALLAKADILIADSGPASDEARLMERHPCLVIAGFTPYARQGPLTSWRGNEASVQAWSGALAYQWPEGSPRWNHFAFAEYIAAIQAAFGAVAALYARDVTGYAQRVDTSLLAANMVLHAGSFVYPEDPEIRHAASEPSGPFPYQLFPTADAWLFLACGTERFWRGLCEVLGKPELAVDPRYDHAAKRSWHKAELAAIIEAILRQRPRAEWLEAFEKAGIPCAPVQSLEALFDDPQIRHNGMVIALPHPVLGDVEMGGIPVLLSDTPGQPHGPAPALGEHTDEILREMGYTDARIATLRRGHVIA